MDAKRCTWGLLIVMVAMLVVWLSTHIVQPQKAVVPANNVPVFDFDLDGPAVSDHTTIQDELRLATSVAEAVAIAKNRLGGCTPGFADRMNDSNSIKAVINTVGVVKTPQGTLETDCGLDIEAMSFKKLPAREVVGVRVRGKATAALSCGLEMAAERAAELDVPLVVIAAGHANQNGDYALDTKSTIRHSIKPGDVVVSAELFGTTVKDACETAGLPLDKCAIVFVTCFALSCATLSEKSGIKCFGVEQDDGKAYVKNGVNLTVAAVVSSYAENAPGYVAQWQPHM